MADERAVLFTGADDVRHVTVRMLQSFERIMLGDLRRLVDEASPLSDDSQVRVKGVKEDYTYNGWYTLGEVKVVDETTVDRYRKFLG